MWDIDEIVRRHNAAALDNMMQTLRMEVVQHPQPDNWALSVLVEKLRTGPPLLLGLLSAFDSVETMSGFLELIMRYLPQHETEILKAKLNERLYRFSQLWKQKYFPLHPWAHQQSIANFVGAMPVTLMGLSYTAYHDLAMRPGYIMLLSLVEYPYAGDERDEDDDPVPFDPFDPMTNMDLRDGSYQPAASDVKWLRDLVDGLGIGGQWIAPMGFTVVKLGPHSIELKEAKDTDEVRATVLRTVAVAKVAGIKANFKRHGRTAAEKLHGARVAILDATRQIVGEQVARSIPPSGWTAKELHKFTDDTLYEGVGDFASWACSETKCVLLDFNYEHCEYNEGDIEPSFKWSPYNIKTLTTQWPRVRQIREKIDNMVEYLEGDPMRRFGELMELLAQHPPAKRKSNHSPHDSTGRMTPLDQVFYGEEEDEYYE